MSEDLPIDVVPDPRVLLPVALLRTDGTLQVTWANPAAVALLGTGVVGASLLDLVDAADHPQVTALHASSTERVRVRMRPRGWGHRLELRRGPVADGERTIAVVEQPLDDGSSEPSFAAQRDALVVLVPYTLQVVRGNPAADALFGRGPSGWVLSEVVPPAHRAVFRQRVLLAVERPEPFEFDVIEPDGALVPVEGVVSPLVSGSGERWLLAVRDRRSGVAAAAERDRVEREQQTIRRDAMKRAAAAVAGPFAELVEAFDRLLAADLQGAEAQAVRSRSQAIALALVQLGRTAPRTELAFDLRDEVRAAAAQLGRDLPALVQVAASIGDEPVVLRGDAAAWRAALVAVGRDAAQRVQFGGRVQFALWRVRQSYWLEVRDDGAEGLAPEAAERLFEVFARPDGDLSLALAEATARVHGGSVSARSERGSGTTITFRGVVPEEAVEALPRLRVLVIDDDPAVRRGLLRILARHHEVLQAEGAPEAFAALRAQEVDLVLCDLHLAGTSGLDVCREVRRAWPGLTVLLMTGFVEDPESSPGVADAVLEKPFSYATFAAAVRDVRLRGARARG